MTFLTLDTFPARYALASIDNAFVEEIRQLLFGKDSDYALKHSYSVVQVCLVFYHRDAEAQREENLTT